MNTEELVRRRVPDYSWRDDINCATTSLKTLSEHFDVPLLDQALRDQLGLFERVLRPLKVVP